MSDLTDDQIIARAKRAEGLLRDELLVEAFNLLRAEYLLAFEGSKPDQTDVRERIYAHVASLKSVKDHLQSVMETGKMVLQQANELKGRLPHATREP